MNAPDLSAPQPGLQFDHITPVAPHALGGLLRDHFSNGRLFATVSHHGGILHIGYWGNQHLGAASFFRGDAGTAWVKLFRFSVKIDAKRYYPTLRNTELMPFGLRGRSEAGGVSFSYELLLLPDALVQRVKILANPDRRKIGVELLHQEAITAVARGNRTWADFQFSPERNALITSCTDKNPPRQPDPHEQGSLAQEGLRVPHPDAPVATTWIALGCDAPISTRCGYHARSKHYIETTEHSIEQIASYVLFATDEERLNRRLSELSTSAHRECDELIRAYETRLASRPRIRTGRPVLDSAFGQYPEAIEHMKIPEQPGAVRATMAGYFVWGWDGMMALFSSPLANEGAYSAEILRFFHQTRDEQLGLSHQLTTAFQPNLKMAFSAQAQYLAGLYLYTATTGDLGVAREVWPTVEAILEHCRKTTVPGTGLGIGPALWPDFPEAMEENGHDISSMNNSLLYQGLRAVEYLAGALDKAALAQECREWARTLRASFKKYLYDEEKGFFISSCSSVDFKPRKHYCPQSIFWLSPFARELVSHAPGRIAAFLDQHLRSAKCLLTLPHWDTAWMADGNQLGSSFPAADSFYLGVHKMIGDDFGLKSWTGDVEWFWRYHTAPEAFTPEAENEHDLGPDNIGCKQLQALATWYGGAYFSLAGLDFDHEGLTLTPWGELPVEIHGARWHGVSLDLAISGRGTHLAGLKLNGKPLPAGVRKVSWDQLAGPSARLEWERTEQAPAHPVIVRADGLRVTPRECGDRRLTATVSGKMSGEVVVQADAASRITLDGKPLPCPFDAATSTFTIPFGQAGEALLEIAGR